MLDHSYKKRGNIMRRLISLLCIVSLLGLAGCNNVSGFGRDVQKVGGKVEDQARDCQAGDC